MPTSSTPRNTDFTRDVLGRYVCNGLDEPLASTDTNLDPNVRPFDMIVVGGRSFGPRRGVHAGNPLGQCGGTVREVLPRGLMQ
jgi:hypothetical protein